MNGSGKTHVCMLMLRQLFDIAGGGPETDAFKHLRATFTVLRSMGSAATLCNPESTRMVSITGSNLYKPSNRSLSCHRSPTGINFGATSTQ